MPATGLTWVHIQIVAYCSCFKGDRRGFRSRHHEIHSYGDYRNPPPAHEHEGLRRHFEARATREVHIGYPYRAIIGAAALTHLRGAGFEVLAVAVASVHAHVVAKLPNDTAAIRRLFGEVKRTSLRSVKRWMPGKVWSRGEHPVFVRDRAHLLNAVEYVIFD